METYAEIGATDCPEERALDCGGMEGKYPAEETMPGCEARGETYPAEQQKGNRAAVLDAELSKLRHSRRGQQTKKMKVAEASHPEGRSIKGRNIRLS